MGLLAAIANYVVRKADSPAAWNIAPWQSGRPYFPETDYKSLVDRYAGWVYACAEMNAINCAQIPLRLYAVSSGAKTKALFPTRHPDKSRLEYLIKSPSAKRYLQKTIDVEEVTEHPFISLFQNVNDYMNEFELWEITELYQELTGNAYWLLLKNSMGLPVEIWPLMPQYMKIIPDKKNFISGYEYAPTPTEKQVLAPEDVLHYKFSNPKNNFYGLGPLQACVVAADLSMNMNLHEASLMANRAQPDMALILPPEAGTPKEDEQKRLTEQWYKRFGGVKKAGKLAILTGGAKLERLTLTPQEIAYLQGRKATREEICDIFGVPMSKITSESVNRANADAGDTQYMRNTILPRLRRIEQKINERLLPLYDEHLFCAFDNPVPEDKEFRLKETDTRLKNGYSSINLERQEDGQEPVAWGEVPLIPFGVGPLGSVITPPIGQGGNIRGIKKTRQTLPPLNHPTNFVNQPFIKALQGYFERQRIEILAGFDRDAEAIIKSHHQKMGIDDYLSAWFDLKRWTDEFDKAAQPFIRYTFMGGGERALRQITTEREFDPISAMAIASLEKHKGKSQIVGTKIKQVRKAISEAMEAGEGIKGIRGAIEMVYEGATRYEAELIARTETIWAFNEGAVQGYIQSGYVKQKQWVSSGDDRSCFLKNTLITTKNGNRQICDVKKGDIVLTHNGWQIVNDIMKRLYRGNLTKIKLGNGNNLIATPEHPVFAETKGWIQIKDLGRGDKVHTDKNEVIDIVGIANVHFFKVYNFIAKIMQFFISILVFSKIGVPINTIYLKTRSAIRKIKINTISTYLKFLDKFNFQSYKSKANLFFNKCLAFIFSITGKRTKSPLIFCRRDDSELSCASKASNQNCWTTTKFRTKMSKVFAVVIKYLSTSLADLVNGRFATAFHTTNVIAMTNTFFDNKGFIANRANFFNLVGSKCFITNSRTIDFMPLTFRWAKGFFASGAYSCKVNFCSSMVTLFRAIKRRASFLDFIYWRKIFTAILTIMSHIRRYCNNYITNSQSLFVYNLEVAQSHTYFANGILVHNCESCLAMDGEIVDVEEDYFAKGEEWGGLSFDYENVSHPPLHPSCRCCIVPIISGID